MAASSRSPPGRPSAEKATRLPSVSPDLRWASCWPRAARSIDGKAVSEAALAGDRTAVDVIEEIGRNLGVALTSFANIFEPEAIVVGGGVIAAGDLLLKPARLASRHVRARCLILIICI